MDLLSELVQQCCFDLFFETIVRSVGAVFRRFLQAPPLVSVGTLVASVAALALVLCYLLSDAPGYALLAATVGSALIASVGFLLGIVLGHARSRW